MGTLTPANGYSSSCKQVPFVPLMGTLHPVNGHPTCLISLNYNGKFTPKHIKLLKQ